MHNKLEPNYINVVIKTNKFHMNCGIIAVVVGIILSIMGQILSTALKHNRYKIEHNRPGPIQCTYINILHF